MVPEAVLAAFGVAGSVPARLPGGQGGTWRAGQVVLKRADSPRSARWIAELWGTLSGPGFRVPRPVRSTAGDWVADGWVAWQWLPGATASWRGVSPYWPRLVAASRAFHAALAGVPAPAWLGSDGSPWTVADQVAWGGRDPGGFMGPPGEPLRAQLGSLFGALRPVDLPAQVVHGDLGGNVLFADGSPPAVIDFAPYWRPAGLAIAVAAVDALLWSGASPAILDELAGEPDLDQLLARALIYRLVTEIIFRPDGSRLDGVARAGQPVADLVLARLSGRPRPDSDMDDARLAGLAAAAVGILVTEMAETGTRTDDGLHGPAAGPSNAAVGYTRAVRRLARLADGRTVFVKASGAPGAPGAPGPPGAPRAAGSGADVTDELAAYETIGPLPFMPRLIAVGRAPVPLLVLEALPADGWVTHWTPETIAATEDLLARVHAVKAPARLPRWTDPGDGGPNSWPAIARHPARLLRMQICDEEWLSAHLDALTAAAGQARLSGDRLVHGDVCGANLCYRGGELVLADWGTAAAGGPWFDYHDWLVVLAAEGGPLPDERQGPGAASHAALIAGGQVLLTPSRTSDPVLFGLRRQRAAIALAWAARLLGLPPPE